MLRRLSLFGGSAVVLCVALAFSVALAQQQPAQDLAGQGHALPGEHIQEQARPLETRSFWKVESEQNTVYLLGSIHLLKQEDFIVGPQVEDVYAEVDNLVFEADLDSIRTPRFLMYVMSRASYEAGKTLKTELSDSAYTVLDSTMTTLGLDIRQMHSFKPWFASLTVVAVKLAQLGFDPSFGIDTYLYAEAKSEGKGIVSLETPEYQIDLLSSLLEAEQEDLLFQTLEEMADVETLLDEIVSAWKAGDLDRLDRSLNASFAEYPELREALINKRNESWIQHIEDYLKQDEGYLVTVGVGHMPGEKGLISLLKARGYRVTQM